MEPPGVWWTPPAEIVSGKWTSRDLMATLPSDISGAAFKIGAYFVSRRFTNPAPIKKESAYLKYKVTKAFKVWEGPIAPWFEQRGHGLQQKLDRTLLPGDGWLNVAWLINNGYLARVN